MEWREQSTVTYQDAYLEAQRWIEAVTKKTFKGKDFRSALENGVLLCDLINRIKPGVVKKVNRLPTPIAGLDNINVFLKACFNLGLKEAQLFHPGDLQDLSSRVTVKDQETNRRLKNVLITLYWLGRRAQSECSYDGPYLNFKAFEGLLGIALHKALQELSGQKDVRDGSFGDNWYSEQPGGGGGGHRREDSLDSLDSLGSPPHSISSDATLKGSSEGCYSDAEADAAFKMADNKESVSYRRSLVLTPKVTTQFNQFLPTKDKPSGYVPAPLRKKRTDRNEDNRRSWANPVYEDEAPLTRSKSTSDIPEEPLVTRRPHYEELEKYREQVKQSEDKWQDDLSKWKNRRKSVNSDIVKKKEEREKVEQITYGSNRRSKTFKEMQEDRDNRRNSSIGSRIRTLSFDDDQDVFEKPTPRSREILSRSYTIDTPFQSSNSVAPSQKEDNHPASSQTRVRSTKQESDTVDAPAGTTSRSAFHRPKPSGAVSSMRSSVFENTSTVKTEETSSIVSASRAPQKVPAPRSPVNVQPPSFGSTYKQPQPSAMKANPPAVSRVSASLPRSYQRSDSARLTSVVAPRPFGTQASRVGSLTRSFTLDDSNNRVNGDIAVSKNSSVPSRYRQFMTPEDEAESQSSLAHSSEDEDEQEETAGKTVTSTSSILSDQVLVKKDVPAKDSNQESSCEMRINLNQKPNSSRDFGFEAAWDSTGAHVTSVQPGSPAEIFRLQPGDEVLMVNGHRVADMSYLDWKASMDEALQEGSLVMDVRRYGQNTWDRDLPSLPFKSHKTINLTTTDHPILVGFPDASGANTLDFTSRGEISPSAKTPTHSVVDVASNGVDGGFPTVSLTTMTNDSEPLSLKNLKRRSEFFEQGGADSATPDIPVPSITQSSRSWSWDPEEERKRQEKWQKEQERLLQEKYKRGQEKLQEEWLKAQQEISFTVAQQEPVSPRSPLSYLSWEEEERKRKEEEVERQRLEEERKRREEEEKKRREEELERQIREEERKRREEELERQIREEERKRREEELERQIQEEERKRREEEVERQRLAEERKRREEELERQLREEEERRRKREEELERQRRDREEEERKRKEKESEERRQREEEELLWQRRREQEKEELRRRQAAAEEQQRQDREQRAKSFDEEEKFQRKGVSVNPGGMVHWLLEEQARSSRDRLARSQRAVAELEMERRNLLNVMRYREPERVTGGSLFDSKGPQPASQAELQRQQLLDDMRKKTPVLTDSSWIRQRAATTPGREDLPPNRRGGSLDNLDNPHNSWRSSWTPRSDSYIPNYSRHTAPSAGLTFYGGGPSGERSGSNTLPASLQGLSSGSAPWSRQSPSLSPYFLSPTTSPEPASDAGDPRQRSRSVSGKKVCTFCGTTLGKGAAMIIESLGLCYHLTCFKCFDCKSDLGGSEAGAEVRIRNKQLYCNSCYVRFKTGQPTSM
ncbi:LIM domain only protein 7 isoform X2 [Dunckerocampus dactyliophorus]|uniref:LIM domain only protein 7 isoform X2 n=1 Tax=Dunckerocampus dactyliophorus TaxID=161453 RepID=UPI002406B053|nr:LIM domain only protein 7 isoform X2 [Dunckerocampus dactyliophorus]